MKTKGRIVRTWRDASGLSDTEWHGSVEHIATKKLRNFRDFADLSAFIAVHRDDAGRE